MCKAAAENVYSEIEAGQRPIAQNGDNDVVGSGASKNINMMKGANAIGIRDVQNAAKEMFGTVLHLAVSTAAVFEALFFISVASLRRSCGQERGRFDVGEVLTKMHSVASASGNMIYLDPHPPGYHDLCRMLPRLAEVSSFVSSMVPMMFIYVYM